MEMEMACIVVFTYGLCVFTKCIMCLARAGKKTPQSRVTACEDTIFENLNKRQKHPSSKIQGKENKQRENTYLPIAMHKESRCYKFV